MLRVIIITIEQDGWTPLHFAAMNGHMGAVEVLVTAGANTQIANKVMVIIRS